MRTVAETEEWELGRSDYERLLEAADTYRKALVVRLVAEVGLRAAEVPRVRPRDVRAAPDRPSEFLVDVPPAEGDEDAGRVAYVPRDVKGAFDRYVRSNGVESDERVVDVSARRVQMLIADVAERAAERTGDPRFADVTAGDLRAFFARTLLVEENVDPRVVRVVGGWKSLESLDRYLEEPGEATIADELAPAGVRPNARRAAAPEDEGASGRGASLAADGEFVRSLLAGSDARALVRLDADGYVERWVGGAGRCGDGERGDLVGRHLSAFYPDEDAEAGRPRQHLDAAADAGRYEEEGWRLAGDGRRFWARVVLTARRDRGGVRGYDMLLWDLTDRKRRERRLRERVESLERRRRVRERVRAVDDAALSSASRGDLEAAVCERLVDGREYAFAWIATTELDEDRCTPTEWEGVDRDALDALDEQFDGAAPWTEALRSGAVEVEPVRDDPTDGGVATVIALPLAHRETTYGALVVAATRETVPDWERSELAALGRRVGHAVTAMQRRNLLLSDAVVELEFWCDDPGSVFVDVSDRLDCTFRLESIVPVSESSLLFYVTMSGAAPGDAFDAAVAHRGVDEVRLVETHDDGCLLEFVVGGDSPLLTLTAYGATITEAVVESGEARLLAEIARDADLRSVVDGLKTAFPRTELVGKHEVERPVRTVREFREGVEDRLTDKQAASLRAAYYAGYFDWPRGSTAEEIADSMNVSSPTLHNHLRKGQRALLETFFEGSSVSQD